MGQRIVIHAQTVAQFLQQPARWGGPYDIVFADPPYDTDAAARLVAQFRIVQFGRVLSIEHPVDRPIPGDDTRRYGDTAVTLVYAP